MDKRLRKVKRILKVQEQLHKMAEWKLVQLQRQVTELRDAQTGLIETLNKDDALHGLFVESAAKRIQALAAQENQVEQLREVQSKVVMDKAMQVKRTERMIDGLTLETRRFLEKKDYLSLLDSLTAKRDASLP